MTLVTWFQETNSLLIYIWFLPRAMSKSMLQSSTVQPLLLFIFNCSIHIFFSFPTSLSTLSNELFNVGFSQDFSFPLPREHPCVLPLGEFSGGASSTSPTSPAFLPWDFNVPIGSLNSILRICVVNLRVDQPVPVLVLAFLPWDFNVPIGSSHSILRICVGDLRVNQPVPVLVVADPLVGQLWVDAPAVHNLIHRNNKKPY